jgi:hypothetical protein
MIAVKSQKFGATTAAWPSISVTGTEETARPLARRGKFTMGGPRRSSDSQTVAGNRFIHEEVRRLAQEKGWDQNSEITLFRDPEFDFFGYAQQVFKRLGFFGQDTEHLAHTMTWQLIYDMKNGGPGKILRSYDGRIPFDDFFKLCIKRSAITQKTKRDRERQRTPYSIVPGQADENQPGAISEGVLSGGAGVAKELEEAETQRQRHERQVLGVNIDSIREMLLARSHGSGTNMANTYGERMWKVWNLKHENKGWSDQKVADALNAEGYPTPRGKPWSRAAVNGLWEDARALVRDFLEQAGYGDVIYELEQRRFAPGQTKKSSRMQFWTQKG